MKIKMIQFSDDDKNDYKTKLEDIKNKLEILLKTKYSNTTKWQHKYIFYITEEFEDILIGSFDKLTEIKKKFDIIQSEKKCEIRRKKNQKCNCNICKSNTELFVFLKEIQEIFNYKHKSLIKYYTNNGYKTCYVCNAQYAVFAIKDYRVNTKNNKTKKKIYISKKKSHIIQKENKAKFQLDHYYPKSLYPALSVSLSNLFPICSSCNQVKTNGVFNISEIYSNVKYEICEQSLIEYFKKDETSMKGVLVLNVEDNSKEKLAEKFDLKGIYDEHIDHIEELIERKIKYVDNYKINLERKFKGIVISVKNIDDRLLLGTYNESDGYFKRPLSKFINDINNQLDSYEK